MPNSRARTSARSALGTSKPRGGGRSFRGLSIRLFRAGGRSRRLAPRCFAGTTPERRLQLRCWTEVGTRHSARDTAAAQRKRTHSVSGRSRRTRTPPLAHIRWPSRPPTVNPRIPSFCSAPILAVGTCEQVPDRCVTLRVNRGDAFSDIKAARFECRASTNTATPARPSAGRIPVGMPATGTSAF
jgi:hypothetical protein